MGGRGDVDSDMSKPLGGEILRWGSKNVISPSRPRSWVLNKERRRETTGEGNKVPKRDIETKGRKESKGKYVEILRECDILTALY